MTEKTKREGMRQRIDRVNLREKPMLTRAIFWLTLLLTLLIIFSIASVSHLLSVVESMSYEHIDPETAALLELAEERGSVDITVTLPQGEEG